MTWPAIISNHQVEWSGEWNGETSQFCSFKVDTLFPRMRSVSWHGLVATLKKSGNAEFEEKSLTCPQKREVMAPECSLSDPDEENICRRPVYVGPRNWRSEYRGGGGEFAIRRLTGKWPNLRSQSPLRRKGSEFKRTSGLAPGGTKNTEPQLTALTAKHVPLFIFCILTAYPE